jgi:hypothetical protein
MRQNKALKKASCNFHKSSKQFSIYCLKTLAQNLTKNPLLSDFTILTRTLQKLSSLITVTFRSHFPRRTPQLQRKKKSDTDECSMKKFNVREEKKLFFKLTELQKYIFMLIFHLTL